jgi:Methane/Phenol/Toluene Hydroxylase
MMDEIRHTQLQMALRNYYVKHWRDPAGWDLAQKALYQHPGGIVSIGLFQNFNTGDPIDCIVNLNIVVETGFTNILLVAVPQIAVANGDHALATTFLSIQSDEARHMANGYGSVMAVLQDEDNVPALNEALERHFWHTHRGLDALVSWQSEYGATVRPWAYKDQWQEWVVDDFIGSYIDRMSEFGVKAPDRLGAAAAAVPWMPHTLGMVLAAIWPLNFWRSDAMGPLRLRVVREPLPGVAQLLRCLLGGVCPAGGPGGGPHDPPGAPRAAPLLPGVPAGVRVPATGRQRGPHRRAGRREVRRVQRGVRVDPQALARGPQGPHAVLDPL